MSFTDLQTKRRSIYALGRQVTQTPEALYDLVKSAVKQSPTSFNNQSVRAVVLMGDAHEKLWDMTAQRLQQEVPDEAAYQQTLAKINHAFKAGFGTVLFYTDTDVVKMYEEQIPLYAENFYDWSEQGHGMAEYATWLALTEAGLGASLQHYNPLIDEAVAAAFDIPDNWRLRAQMPFGSIEAAASEKDMMSDAERFKFFN
ncbi:nitroreductase family protein [Leuconostoc lactis]|uniref:Nitroreductase n=1 Tax=Leuconostoc lactis TaxID=1246 RepID=A0A6L7ACK0_LEULA|nr:nitroreductase family protein [Leuconostoc lactis]ANY11049.1 nitroreductase [Leuconostoc lactis]MBU7537619.1 nitroreductase family protein [Leuconostoc lactis]MCT8387122.1 nitroreductase [Leuconostoc lactis]MDI6495396.1 nitroreductase family protein [Leuconostoc lactis]MSB66037.1 nitroreductase [Leuconostoc lactis]